MCAAVRELIGCQVSPIKSPERGQRLFLVRNLLVAKVALAGEDHGDAVLVSCGDRLVVPNAATRLDHRSDSGRCGGIQTVPEGEERITGTDPSRRTPSRAFGGDPRRV